MTPTLASLKATWAMRAFAAAKIPLLFYVRPSVIAIDDERCELRIRLRRRTRNHVGSMYVGVLATGADAAGGFLAIRHIEAQKLPVAVLFKDMRAEFLKRPEADVHFTCVEGQAIRAMLTRVMQSGERENMPIVVVATCPSLSDEPVAKFEMTLTMKVKRHDNSKR